ncbi:MAG: hypothetical protein J7L32_00445 [Thermoplasmata archaeon]|nr:hypothetical protein [Thermoplasmata archaeon]RLF27253.1 MAG: hypothetical protein DRN01_02905 [Thermoplasmata archaeon]
MKKRVGEVLPVVAMTLIFIVVYFFAILTVEPFENAGVQAFENPGDPTNIVYFLAILLGLTIVILLIARFWNKKVIHLFILAAVALTIFSMADPLFFLIVGEPFASALALILAFVMVILLVYYPEWYVVDTCGVLISVGAIAIFGISLTIPLVVSLLVVLAVYDALSVYKTKHMIDLADTVVDLKLPVLFVIPKTLPYSFREQVGGIKKKLEKNEERDAFFMGVGDVVLPGILVASCYRFAGKPLVCLSIVAGILVGFFFLMILVAKGKPQPGLPLLNTGAILGYILSSLFLYGGLVGFTF